MPPTDKRDKYPPLTKDQIGLIRAWIDQGAKSVSAARPVPGRDSFDLCEGIAPLIFGPTFVLALIVVLILEAKLSDGERGRQA